MVVELINTGSELLLGRTVNTHQQWLCRELTDLGYAVAKQVAIPDTAIAIETSVREALTRADLVITTGGLGPTSDDLTREMIASLVDKPLREDPGVMRHIEEFFAGRQRSMPASTRRQAQVPEGAIVLPNINGTAPGLAMELRPNPYRGGELPSWIVMLPGPPRELRPMFRDAVTPLLRRVLPPADVCCCRNLRTTGLGESMVEELIAEPLGQLVRSGLEIGYCARTGQVDVRLSSHGAMAAETVERAAGIVRALVGNHLCSENEEELENVVVRLLREGKSTLSVAESCTGGFIAHRITNVPGASAIFLEGYVTYSNEAKERALGVSSGDLATYGAVSEVVAQAMADGALTRSGATYALAVTGIAGPGGGSIEKPVGTVYIALAGGGPALVEHHFNNFDRETFKYAASQQALDLLRRRILEKGV